MDKLFKEMIIKDLNYFFLKEMDKYVPTSIDEDGFYCYNDIKSANLFLQMNKACREKLEEYFNAG